MASNSLAKLALAPFLALGLASCFGGAKAPPELLTLTAAETLPPGATRSSGGEAVVVLAPTVSRAVGANRIAVYVSPTSIQYLTNGVWADQPNALFQRLLSEVVAVRTGRLVIDPANYAQQQAVTLGGQLLQFGLDPTRNEAVVVFEASVSRGPTGLQTQRFEARVPVAQQTAAVVAPALNQASNQVAQQVADWLGR
jgi:cholesterol transport system auxiliary component